MDRVKEAIVTIEDMFNEEFEKLEKMLADSLEDFQKNGYDDEDVLAEIKMATCEGRLQAYALVAWRLLGDKSLEDKYDAVIEKYTNDAMEIVGITDEMDDEEEEKDEEEDEEDADDIAKNFTKFGEIFDELGIPRQY